MTALAKLRALEAAATKEPWRNNGEIYSDAAGTGDGPLICATEADAELLVAARNLLSPLLDLWEAAETLGSALDRQFAPAWHSENVRCGRAVLQTRLAALERAASEAVE